MAGRWRARLPIYALAGWILLIFAFSSQPYDRQTIQPALHGSLNEQTAEDVLPEISFVYNDMRFSTRDNPFGVIEFAFRKSAHLFVYGMLAVLASLGLRFLVKPWRSSGGALLLVVSIAALDEWNQRRIPGRTSNPEDVVVDFIGGCAGLLVFLVARAAMLRIKRPRVS